MNVVCVDLSNAHCDEDDDTDDDHLLLCSKQKQTMIKEIVCRYTWNMKFDFYSAKMLPSFHQMNFEWIIMGR